MALTMFTQIICLIVVLRVLILSRIKLGPRLFFTYLLSKSLLCFLGLILQLLPIQTSCSAGKGKFSNVEFLITFLRIYQSTVWPELKRISRGSNVNLSVKNSLCITVKSNLLYF